MYYINTYVDIQIYIYANFLSLQNRNKLHESRT